MARRAPYRRSSPLRRVGRSLLVLLYAAGGLSGALLLRHSLGLEQEAAAIERAVSQVLDEGYRTGDIFSAGCTKVGCTQMGDLVAERV